MKATLLLIWPIIAVWNAEARRAGTPPVPPVTYNGVIYSAPHAGSKGGVVEAHDQETKAWLWSKRVYGVEYAGDLEEDCQWIYVKSLSVTNGLLFIVNEADHAFTLDPKTREVTALSKDMVAFEIGGDASVRTVGSLVSLPECLEVTCTLLKFDRGEIEALAKDGQLRAENILHLWRADKGCLLARPSMTVMSGQENVIKSVREVTYPTELAYPDGSNTNLQANGNWTPVPSNFEMREVGVIVQCVAQVEPPSETIRMLINVQYVCEPSWKTYATQVPSLQGRPIEARLDLPFFPVYSFANTVNIQNGATILIGGGIPTEDEKSFVFALLTGAIAGKDEPTRQRTDTDARR